MLNRHLYALLGALKAMRTNPWAVVINTLILGISIGFCLALTSAAKWLDDSNSRSAHTHVYLEFSPHSSRAEQQEFQSMLARNPLVTQSLEFNLETELAALAAQLRLETAALTGALSPLPKTLAVRIGPAGPRAQPTPEMDALIADWRASPAIERVSVFAENLSNNNGDNQRYAHALFILSTLIAVSVALMASNMVRNQVLRQTLENEIARYCGADPAFLRRPFLYWGTLQVLLGTATGLAIFQLARIGLKSQGIALDNLGITNLAGTPLGVLHEIAFTLPCGAALGLACAWITSKLHLREQMDE